jgi:hypothetical protein
MSFGFEDCVEKLESQGLVRPPQLALEILEKREASPRLIAHHFLVHAAACDLTSALVNLWPGLNFDVEAVLFGAASHDIGKVLVPQELSEPGKRHESLGWELLLEASIPRQLARFAETHGQGAQNERIEDLLVCLADKCWKGKREDELEERLVTVISNSLKIDFWDAHPEFVSLVDSIAASADMRLAIQSSFPCPPNREEEEAELRRNPPGEAAFDFHLERVVNYFQEICPEAAWSDIRFFEGDPFGAGTGPLSKTDLHKPEDYSARFCELLEQGHGWINLSASGVLNDLLILSLEWPGYENSVPREYVSVNLSGPYRVGGWDLSNRLKLNT